MAGGAGVSGTGVGGISVGGSAGWAGAAGGNEVTDTLQALNINVKAIKAYFNFIQEDSFQDIQTIQSPESSIQLSKINICCARSIKPA